MDSPLQKQTCFPWNERQGNRWISYTGHSFYLIEKVSCALDGEQSLETLITVSQRGVLPGAEEGGGISI